jgi:hypothetical protein
VLLAQRSRVFACSSARIGPLAETKILLRDARRLAHDVDEHRHLVERADVLLVPAVRLRGGIVERFNVVRAEMCGQHRGFRVVVLVIPRISHNFSAAWTMKNLAERMLPRFDARHAARSGSTT